MTFGLLAVSAEASFAQAPTAPTLGGEKLLAQDGAAGSVGTLTISDRNCNPDGESTLAFRATGPATGLYPGTFVEEGTFTLGAPSYPSSTVIALEATFSIDSPVGQVTGTKIFEAVASGHGTGICNNFPAPATQQFVGTTNNLRYEAEIELPDGATCTDSGGGLFVLSENFTPPPGPGRDSIFQEFFSSDNPVSADCPVPVPPECSDQQDNDSDGRTDYPADAGCTSARDESEAGEPACQDGRDNDHDKKVDFPNDDGCSSPSDNSEKRNDKVKKDKNKA